MWPAKKFGARVSKYMIGFGPTIFKRQVGETLYGIKLLPIGGYVAISGMLPPQREGQKMRGPAWLRDMILQARLGQREADGQYDESRAFYKLPVLKRIVVMLGGPVMNLFLGTLFFAIAFLGIGVTQAGNKIEHVLTCAQTQITAGKEHCVPAGSRTPASLAGLKAGDVVSQVNGLSITSWEPVRQLIAKNPNASLQLVVLRGGKQLAFNVKPQLVKEPALDASGNVLHNSDGSIRYQNIPLLGIQLNSARAPMTVSATFQNMGQVLAQTGQMVLAIPSQMTKVVESLAGKPRSQDGLVSIVGIGNISGSVASNNDLDIPGKIGTWLLILGSLNYALFVFNLLPLLPLDGGHVLNAAIDGLRNLVYKIRGRAKPAPLDTAKMVPFTTLMWVLLMGMGVLTMLADVLNPLRFG
jgi:membrane-associated protease RseP (regulator of RpoE activity)